MTGRGGFWMAGVAGLAIGAAAVAALSGGAKTPFDPQRAAIETVVREYILSHPEIIPEAMAKLQSNETGKLVAANRKAIETPFAGGWAGAADGDVVLVEFFDYACGFCRQSVADVDRLIAEDKKLKVVFRELPILSDESGVAARASLAAAKQGKFLRFYNAMYAAGRPAKDTIARAVAASGVEGRQAQADATGADVAAEIARNIDLARTLSLSGTPTFVVGDRLLSGAVGYDELKKAIAEARARKSG